MRSIHNEIRLLLYYYTFSCIFIIFTVRNLLAVLPTKNNGFVFLLVYLFPFLQWRAQFLETNIKYVLIIFYISIRLY